MKRFQAIPIIGASLVAQQIRVHLPTLETQVRSLGWPDPLEKEMAIHASIPAWEIPWTEEYGGLQNRVTKGHTRPSN